MRAAPLTMIALLVLSGIASAKTRSWISPGPALPHIVLTDHDGNPVAFDRLVAGRVVAVNFFFTQCSSVCPAQTAILRQTKELIEKEASADRKPLFISISVDPRIDTPTRIRQYAERFDLALGETHDWVMLTGAPEATSTLIAAFDETAGPTPGDHSGSIWIGSQSAGRWARIPTSSAEASSPAALASILREAAR